MAEDKTYTLQYDIVTEDRMGGLVATCFHGPGRMGFDTAEEAKGMIDVLQEANRQLGDESTCYTIRTILVSNAWDQAPEFTIDSDELKDMLELGPMDGESNGGGPPPASN